MAENKTIEQPSDSLQQKLDELFEAAPETVEVSGKKYTIGWLHNGTIRKFTHITQTEEDAHKQNAKLMAIVLLNNKFKIMFLYWFVWRWLYYVKDVDDVTVLRILDVAKKKIQHEAFWLDIMYSTEMSDLMMTMTKAEVKAIRAAQRGAQPTT